MKIPQGMIKKRRWLGWLWLFSTQPLAGIIHADQAAYAAIAKPSTLFAHALETLLSY